MTTASSTQTQQVGKLVVFGASGRTGRALLKLAVEQQFDVYPIVRDDKDGKGLDSIIDIGRISYANADHIASLPAVLDGATTVVSCIDPRTAGPGTPLYSEQAGAHIIQASAAAGISRILHMSVVGAYRWSAFPLNRASFHIDRQVRTLKDLPWSMIRVSCYMDEIIDGLVYPPDQRRPHPVPHSSRYAPISRRDVARMVLDLLPRLVPNRTLYVGGPQVFRSEELNGLLQPYRSQDPGLPFRRTKIGGLPPGDISVAVDTSRIHFQVSPLDTLADVLKSTPGNESRVESQPPPTVYPKEAPPDHQADQQRSLKILQEMNADLRRTVHAQLVTDLKHMNQTITGVELDFGKARKRRNGVSATIHDGTISEMTGVAAIDPKTSETLHRGAVNFLYDELADVFFCWWDRDTLPIAIWNQLDLGVKRRLVTAPRFANDATVRRFATGHEVTTAS